MPGARRAAAVAVLVAAGAAWQMGPAAPQTAPPESEAALAVRARKTVQAFTDRLKAELTAALKSGGPVASIGVCHTTAPDLVTTLSDDSGFEVSRTAVRLRNPENAPD